MNNVDDSSNEVCASKIISEDIYSALRDSQKTSLDVSFDYLSQKNNNKSCLISLPTGGGKTGVICLLSHYSRQQKILVLCHRKAVKNQLIKQLSGGFFEKIDVKPTDELKVVNSDILDTTEDGIYVTTFQKLRLMTKEQMTVLRSDIDLVIVDEGHSEPSPEWSKLTRGLDAYKVVVTATPYRNDLFQFDISHEYSYFYSFKDAVAANDIEKPVFESIKKKEIKRKVMERSDTRITVNPNSYKSVRNFLDIIGFEERVSQTYGEMQFLCKGCVRIYNAKDSEDIFIDCLNMCDNDKPCNTRMCASCWRKMGYSLCIRCESQICLHHGNLCFDCSK